MSRINSRSIVEEKQMQLLHQALAQTITNAFLQVKLSPCLASTLVPSFKASKQGIQILMYSCASDLLLVSEELPLFDFNTNELDVSTLIYLWLSLNIDIPAQSMDTIDWNNSNFSGFVKIFEKYNCYSEGVTHPCDFTDKDTQKLKFESSVLALPVIAPYITKAKKYYNSASKKFYDKK
jgi:hypothetical protein